MEVRHPNGFLRSVYDDPRDRLAPEPDELPTVAHTSWDVPIFNQGSLGSCVANAVCSLMAWLDLRDDGHARTYSRLHLYAKTRQAMGVDLGIDSGLFVRQAIATAVTGGVCVEDLWPYHVNRFAEAPPQQADDEAKNHQLMIPVRLPSVRTIKASLAMGFPVVVGAPWPASADDQAAWQTGEVWAPDERGVVGGHSFVIWGYDESRRLLWDCVNSWGAAFGDDGMFYLDEKIPLFDAWSVRAIEP